jgi:hypothetical protein
MKGAVRIIRISKRSVTGPLNISQSDRCRYLDLRIRAESCLRAQGSQRPALSNMVLAAACEINLGKDGIVKAREVGGAESRLLVSASGVRGGRSGEVRLVRVLDDMSDGHRDWTKGCR